MSISTKIQWVSIDTKTKELSIHYTSGNIVNLSQYNTYLFDNPTSDYSFYSSAKINKYYKEGKDKFKYEKLLKFLASVDKPLRQRFNNLLYTYPYELLNDLSIYCVKLFRKNSNNELTSPYQTRLDIKYNIGDEVIDYDVDSNLDNYCSYGLNAYTIELNTIPSDSGCVAYLVRTKLSDIKFISDTNKVIRTKRYIICGSTDTTLNSSLFYQPDKNIIKRTIKIGKDSYDIINRSSTYKGNIKTFTKPFMFKEVKAKENSLSTLLKDINSLTIDKINKLIKDLNL